MPDDSTAVQIARIDERTERMATQVDDMDERLREVCENHGERLARLETRTGLLAVLATGLSALAGWLGVTN